MLEKRSLLLAGLWCAATLSLGACSGQDDTSKGGRGAPQVGFVVVKVEPVPVTTSLGGRTVAFETSEVRPQVNGLIRRRLFTEGGFVRAGQPLYQIDASLYQAAVDQAAANLASARASAQAADERVRRFAPLAKMQAIAEQDYTDALAEARVARAAVAQNSAALETARISLRYATITAPISGRIGRSLATPGALVSASQATPLAVIQQTDPIYVDMQQSSAELTTLRAALASGGVAAGSTSVRLRLEDGSAYGFAGTVQFSDITVSEATGTVTLRARFPNPKGVLLPGMFVTALFDQAINPRAILVPQAAVQRDFDGSAFVYLAGADNKAIRRKVTADRTIGANWVVTDGLKAGERVITQGVGNLKQGAPITAVPASSAQRVGAPAAKTAEKSP
ncbi:MULTISPECIES: efflux RND transporter periplasmic adaptor subunit [unclassified Sphingopyxis]|uniref:efflux RND transporter periplasmic adaptor subunit n=1 Tax=unclassified Sphingopyxis TaxID=2614943 RepID=UPI00286001A5|nr:MULTISPECIES: efflux RND transporter periplasmic adaptor subunit [unclassified Sphingopyxis]MDR6833501.1 membrane fusion protein (multidrug efflux system) [Sphingopyxis sp. BE122]MDR7225770.1 membrane fusion protein (multidrug efflux system) [Sphingopyxis sp. BE259]